MSETRLHPRPDFERTNWQCLDGEWDFRLFPEGKEAEESAFSQNVADSTAYDSRIVVPFSWVSPLSGIGQNVPGVGWYHTTAAFHSEERVFLCFGAIDYLADIYVNGMLVAHHQGGYTQIEADVTEVWHEGENDIVVRAEDWRHETQTYGKQGYGDIQGIWQTVWLEARPAEHIESFKFITRCTGDVDLLVSTGAPDGTSVTACFDGTAFVGEVKEGAARVAMHFDAPRLWTPDAPALYEGEIRLGADVVKTYFGIREISAAHFGDRAYKWITLNGKPVYINATLDQAFHNEGHFTYPTDQSMRDEAWRLKRLGLNGVRIHIKHELPRKLYWMDKLGVMVIADIPCFWGEPNEEARTAYEAEWPVMMARDFNHPSIVQWVMFNESWGLLTQTREPQPGEPRGVGREYLPETQEWVRSVYRRAKALDPTRLIEDNSPCRYDHVETDINTWHFYINGYEKVREHIRNVADNTYPGSSFNCIAENRQTDAPLMNSECGMVWGVDGSAGDSDLSWQYHYMLNEFRLHEKICGFVFTEFHDVINEFNGYYRIDDTDKDWGYQDMCRGMTLRDLHAPDFLAVDCPPCRTMGPGEAAAVPLALSSFSDAHQAQGLSVRWELWHDGLDGRVTDGTGAFDIPPYGYGVTELPSLTVRMPRENAVAVLSLYLTDKAGQVISRNYTTFDVRAEWPRGIVETAPAAFIATGCERVWRAQGGEKLCVAGAASLEAEIALPLGGPRGLKKDDIHGLTLFLEAGSKRFLKKDDKTASAEGNGLNYMRGHRVDRGQFPNSYFMTDEDALLSELTVKIDGVKAAWIPLGNDWADCRGVLSFHVQPDDRKLDEAGSYGDFIRVEIPSRLMPAIVARGSLTLTLESGEGGVALYGRHSGRYPMGVVMRAW